MTISEQPKDEKRTNTSASSSVRDSHSASLKHCEKSPAINRPWNTNSGWTNLAPATPKRTPTHFSDGISTLSEPPKAPPSHTPQIFLTPERDRPTQDVAQRSPKTPRQLSLRVADDFWGGRSLSSLFPRAPERTPTRRGRHSSLRADFAMVGQRKESDASGKSPSVSLSVDSSFGSRSGTMASGTPAVPMLVPDSTAGGQGSNYTYQHIQELSSKRIATLDYLRKAQEGRVYWLNTVLFNKNDVGKLPSFDSKKLARRATNYLLLGLSLPPIIDNPAPSNPLNFLRDLSALFGEFEAYQQLHPPDGSSASSLSRARIPAMFKRAAHSTSGSKGRRTSSATEIGFPMSGGTDQSDTKTMPGSGSLPPAAFPASEQELLPGEEYLHLLTPSLPFDPDYFEVFATLCDVLIDAYTKIMALINSPAHCGVGVGEAFGKFDAKVRKLLVNGTVKEFEDASRVGAKAEIAGIGKVVLGGLM